jgi:hypothetical protein
MRQVATRTPRATAFAAFFASVNSALPPLLPLIDQHCISDSAQRFVFTQAWANNYTICFIRVWNGLRFRALWNNLDHWKFRSFWGHR